MRIRRGSKEQVEADIAERLARDTMSSDERAEQIFRRYKDIPSVELVVELERLQRRYGRVDPVYEAVINKILTERTSAAVESTAPDKNEPGTPELAG